VQIAARVKSLSWDGCLVNSADTDPDDVSRPAQHLPERAAAEVGVRDVEEDGFLAAGPA
jgi:hypothetical protein